jgi:tetratricopeptide (TPR) repeat protein
MSFGGFEAALVRAERNHLSALGYDGGTSPGGATFDAPILNACLRALCSDRLQTYARRMTAADWLDLREEAARLKEMFSISEKPTRAVWLRTLRQRVDIAVTRRHFEAAFGPELRHAVSSAAALLDAAGLKPADLSEVLLVGGCTNLNLLQAMVAEQFSRRPALLAADSVMRGATILANSLELSAEAEQAPARELPLASESGSVIPLTEMSFSMDTGSMPASSTPKAEGEPPAAPDSAPRRAPVVESAVALEQAAAHRKGLFQAARRLFAEGSHDSAAGLLESVMDEAKMLLASVHNQRRAAGGDDDARLILKQANALLENRQYREAVLASHDAYALSKDSPDAYFEMIEIHCRAAAALGTMDGYQNSINLLMCAYGHDRTNSSIHERIAERHFRHAQQLAERGEREKVLATLEQCLLFKPDHNGAEALRAELGSAV